jgi:hypothetical protein
MTETKLESIIKYFPLIFIILTTIGYINLQSYYYFFDIEIINYLEISEIILLFFNKSILIILLLISIISIIYLIDDKISQEINDNEKNLEVLKHKEEKTNKRIFKGGWVLIILTIFFIITNIVSANYIGLIFPIGFLLLIIINRIAEKTVLKIIIKKNDSIFSFFIYFGFQILLLFNLLTISNSIENGYKLRYQSKQSKLVCFSYNGKTIETNKKTIYIGETKKYLFLFDKENEETLIFKMEGINDLKFLLKK